MPLSSMISSEISAKQLAYFGITGKKLVDYWEALLWQCVKALKMNDEVFADCSNVKI